MSTENGNLSLECASDVYRERMHPLSFSHADAADATKGRPAAGTYWGVACRTCHELVAFDVCPYLSFGDPAESVKPGAIRCSKGHNHIYFPRDFQFLPSAVAIANEVMRTNRETYKAINPSFPRHKGAWIVKANPPATSQAEASVPDLSKKDALSAEKDCGSPLMEKKAM
jgi:hypothetical protein